MRKIEDYEFILTLVTWSSLQKESPKGRQGDQEVCYFAHENY